MSSGSNDNNKLRVHNELSELAPAFRAAVERALAECHRQNLDAFVYEAYRSQELQAEYFSRGRTKRPPLSTVTNAPTNLLSWHGYGLAVDVISKSKHWDAGTEWFRKVADIFKRNECKWGGDWTKPDLPHFQWHKCKASPSDNARALMSSGGARAVWDAVGALEPTIAAPPELPPAAPGPPPAAPRVAHEPARTAVVTAKSLNLREDASTAKPPVRALTRGTKLDVLEPHGAWFKVRVDGVEGFVHGDHIDLSDHSSATRFLCTDPVLCSVRLVPDATAPVPAGATARRAVETWNRYGGLLGPLSRAIAVKPESAVAVLCVESGGKAFDAGRIIIRFEAHVFFRLWGKQNRALFDRHFSFNPDQPWKDQKFSDGEGPFQPIHVGGQTREWAVFEAARSLNGPAALRSISMGAPQIMGLHHGRIGYDSVEDMFDAFQQERFQIIGMFDFIQGPGSASLMVRALQQEDYETFALHYNGSGQAAEYGSRIRTFAEAVTLQHA